MTPYELETLKLVLGVADRARDLKPITASDREAIKAAETLIRNEEATEDQEGGTHGMDFFICVGPGSWGRGFTEEQAIGKAASIEPKAKKVHIIYKANTKRTPIAYINDMGRLCHRGETPERIAERGIPGRKAFSGKA